MEQTTATCRVCGQPSVFVAHVRIPQFPWERKQNLCTDCLTTAARDGDLICCSLREPTLYDAIQYALHQISTDSDLDEAVSSPQSYDELETTLRQAVAAALLKVLPE